jgi:hypothetical protein
MSEPEWHIRSGQPTDRSLLASFTCANPVFAWESEVESFIQNQLIDWTFDPSAVGGDPRLLLAFVGATSELFGVAAHERVTLGSSDVQFAATQLLVVAIAESWQGSRFASGSRPSDVMMSAVMTDVSNRVPPRDARVFGLIHEANQRSIAVCRRNGLTEEMSRAGDYLRLVTPHRPRADLSEAG